MFNNVFSFSTDHAEKNLFSEPTDKNHSDDGREECRGSNKLQKDFRCFESLQIYNM